MVIIGTVLQVNRQSLLVRDERNGQEILVNFRNTNRFSVGDRVRIIYNGQMTRSIPPQITAISIEVLRPTRPTPPRPPSPSEMRVVVLQKGRNFLIVWNPRERQQIRVEYPYAHHFCVDQQIIVRYDIMTMSIPPRVNAIDIFPVC